MWRKLMMVPLLLIPVACVAFLVQQGFVKISWLDKYKKQAVPPLVETFKMDSTQTGKAYNIYVQLPPEYRQGTAPYPAIYAIHTGATLFECAAVIDPLRRRSKNPEAIVLNVGPARKKASRFCTRTVSPRRGT